MRKPAKRQPPTVQLRRDALKAIGALIARVERNTAHLYAAELMEEWVYSELYLRNLRKARELLSEPRRGDARSKRRN